MRAELRAGVAIYDAGDYHAAHDAWEDRWLDLQAGTDDERLLHGLIQFTAAVHHAFDANWEGVRGLADSAAGYLADLPDDYRGIDVAAVRSYLRAVAADPEYVERVAVPVLTFEGERLHLADLDFEEAAVAAEVYAEERDRFEEDVVECGVAYARADLDAGEETSPFVALVLDFAREPADRDVAYSRLAERVERRTARDEDVAGLFDGEDG